MISGRRELIKGLAGLGAVACSGRVGRGRLIEGSIVGGASRIGHRLLDGFRPGAGSREETGVVILGAGVAGLSAAWALEHAGFTDFRVIELENAPGGTSRSGANSVSAYPWAAHYIPIPPPENRPLIALLEEVGALQGRDERGRPVGAEHVLCREPQERVFFRGEWQEGLYPFSGANADDLAQLRAFEEKMTAWAGWRDEQGRRGFTNPRWNGSRDPQIRELDRLSMADFMDHNGWDSPRLRWFVEYGCRDDFGSTLSQTSAWAGVHYFAARLDDSEQETAEFLTWPEGNGRLVKHLSGRVGTRLRLGRLVTSVAPDPDGVDVTAFDVASGQAVGLRAEHAVFALPRFLASHLIEPYRGTRAPAHLAATSYGCWMVANLTLSGRPTSRGFPLAWDNVLHDSPSLGYVVATHQAGRDHGPTVLTYYQPFPAAAPRRARRELYRRTWQEWVESILADLGRAHADIQELVERVDVYLWGHAMVRPRPGFMWSTALEESSRPLGRLHFAHSDLSGMALFEEAQLWGIRAAEAILRDRKHAFRSWLE